MHPLSPFQLVFVVFPLPLSPSPLLSPGPMFTKKPATSWLDRLRSSKGFPESNHVDLEQFLHNQNPNSPIQPNHNKFTQTAQQSPHNNRKEENWFNSMSNVLAELFVMEDSTKSHQIPHKKSSRKQPNPKVCIFSASTSVDVNRGERRTAMLPLSPPPSSVDNSVAEVKEEEMEKSDFSGYSRLDLMIIDTSSVVWKTEKKVFRKGSVWKVREMKSKGRGLSVVRKKRKLKQHYDEESEDEKKKRKKRKKKVKKQKLSSVDAKVRGVSPFEGCPENDSQVANKETQPNLDEAPVQRCKFFRSLGKLPKRSSGFHMQNTPTGRKNIVPIP